MPDGRVLPFCSYNVVLELYRDWSRAEYSISIDEWLERDNTEMTPTDAPNRTNRKENVIDAQASTRWRPLVRRQEHARHAIRFVWETVESTFDEFNGRRKMFEW